MRFARAMSALAVGAAIVTGGLVLRGGLPFMDAEEGSGRSIAVLYESDPIPSGPNPPRPNTSQWMTVEVGSTSGEDYTFETSVWAPGWG